MRVLALLLTMAGCAGAGDDTAGPAVEDTDDTDPVVEKLDTGLALVYFEGHADLTTETWTGQEDYVSTSIDGAVEHCRVTNIAEGVASADVCPGCLFAFELTLGAGTLAGEACENLRMSADMFEDNTWIYAFAPSYAYGSSGYTYDNVLLFGTEYEDGLTWTPWAFAEVHGTLDAEGGADIDYETIFAYTAYYYYL